jgi:hypothetical protein
MGFFTPEEVLQQVGQLDNLLEENAALKTELEHARPILNAVANLTGSPVSLDSVSSESSDLAVSESDEGQEPADAITVSGESEVAESTSDKGRGDVSGLKSRNRSGPIIK